MKIRALALGGTGGMGQGAARDLIKQEQIGKVILGGIRLERKVRFQSSKNIPSDQHCIYKCLPECDPEGEDYDLKSRINAAWLYVRLHAFDIFKVNERIPVLWKTPL